MGCSVTSAAFSGFRQNEMKSGVVARTSRYSGKCRPAWRMNQMGSGRTASPASVFKIGLVINEGPWSFILASSHPL